MDKWKGDKAVIVDTPLDKEDINRNKKNVSEENTDLNALHDFIDNKFYSILLNKIRARLN